jgi:DDE domain
VNHFRPVIAANLGKRRTKAHSIWHLDEAYLKIDGRMMYLWRAVDAEGEVLRASAQLRDSFQPTQHSTTSNAISRQPKTHRTSRRGDEHVAEATAAV